MKRMRILALVSMVNMVALSAATAAESQDEVIENFTRPSKIVRLKFVASGRIAEVNVKEGDRVTKSDTVLARQDDEAEQLQLAIMKVQAEDTTRVDYATASTDQAKVDLKKRQIAAESNAVTATELEYARLNVLKEEAMLGLAKLEQQQRIADYEQLKIRIDRMRLRSPIDGVVERVLLSEGETAEVNEDVIVLVTVDPLWVEVPVSLARAQKLKCGQEARLQFPAPTDGGEAPVLVGKIIHKAAVASGSSGKLAVRVEVPNPTRRPAGEKVRIEFLDTGEPTPVAAAGTRGPAKAGAAK